MDEVVAVWRKSRHSQPNGNCIEVGRLRGGAAVRDSKDPDGGYIVATSAQWRMFISAVKTGAF